MLRRTSRQRRTAQGIAIGEALEQRLMLYQHYEGSPKWQFGDRNLTFSYTNALDGGLMGINATQIQNSVNEALALWSAVIPWTFTRVIDPDTNFVTDETYSASGWPIIRIGQHNIDGPRNTLAHGFRPGSNGINGDFHFDISEQWTPNPTPGTWPPYDSLETVLHEMGHVMGLDHEGVNTAIMNASYAGRFNGPATGFLFQDDINGVQAHYGAGLGYVLDIDGTMYVSGTSGSNTISVSYGGGNITVNSAGFGSFTRTASGITKLIIRAGNGNDSITVNQVPFAVEVDGGAGTSDSLQMIAADTNNAFGLNAGNQVTGHSVGTYAGIESIELLGGSQSDQFAINAAPTIPITFNGRFGNDTFLVNALGSNLTLEGDFGNDTFNLHVTSGSNSGPIRAGFDHDTFNVTRCPIATTLDAGDGNDTFNLAVNGGFEAITAALTLNGGAGDDIANLATNAPASVRVIAAPVTFNGGINQDTLYVGGGWLDAVAGAVSFSGGNDGGDQVVLNDSSVSAPYDYSATSSTVTRDPFFGGLTYFGTFKVIVECTQGHNTVNVANGIATRLDLRGNSGNDSFVIGDGLLQGNTGHALNGGSGINNITFDDRNDPTNRIWQIFPDFVNFAGIFLSTVGFQSVTVLAGNGEDTIVFVTATYDETITIDGGGGRDQFTVPGVEMTSLTLRGGNDAVFDFLDIDDRNFPGNVVGGFVYPDRISRDIFPQTSEVFYSGFASVNWYLQAHQNAVAVYGTSSDIGPNFAFNIIGNSVNDYVEVHTRDALGNPTINGNLFFIGNGDADTMAVLSGNVPANLRFYEPFPSSSSYLGGAGTGWVSAASTVENVNVHGSPGNDTFAVEQFKSGSALAIYGGNGNDTCTIGNGDMSANLTNAAAFTFDGQNDSDRFTIANGVTNTAWNYTVRNGSITSARPSTGYSWASVVAGIESQYIFAGSTGDAFYVEAVAPGVYTELNGAAGLDGMDIVGTNTNVDSIQGAITYNGQSGGGNLAVRDSLDSTGDVVHLTATTLGAYAGDSLFGPGGSLTFSDLVNFGVFPGITLNLGSGADIVYAQPLATARVEINGNGPGVAPGDQLNLALAGVQSPFVVHGSTGSVSSSNRQTLTWTGMEQSSQPIDNVAPALVEADINVNGIPGPGDGGARRQALDVRFSENVSGLLNPSWLQLTNLTTNQAVPTANIAVEYEAATNTARFTFPGYPLGVLPDGNYSGKVLAGLPDFFGNGLPADAPFSFFFLQGDANQDGRVNLADFNILAANFGQSNRTFSQGDFNYDGTVNLSDFNLLAGRFGQALGPDGVRSVGRSASRGELREMLDDVLM